MKSEPIPIIESPLTAPAASIPNQVARDSAPFEVAIQQDDRLVRAGKYVKPQTSATNGSMGLAIAAAVLLIVSSGIAVFLFFGGGLAMLGFESKTANEVAEGGAKPGEESNEKEKGKVVPRAFAMSEGQTINGITVRIYDVRIGKVELSKNGTLTMSDSDSLVVSLSLSTKDPSKKYDYQSWNANEGSPPTCSLKDNFGNEYKLLTYGPMTQIIGSPRNISITTRKAAYDLITFELPVEGATELVLDLGADNLSKDEKFRFRIPRELWTESKAVTGTNADDRQATNPFMNAGEADPNVTISTAKNIDEIINDAGTPSTNRNQVKYYEIASNPRLSTRIENYEVKYLDAAVLIEKPKPQDSLMTIVMEFRNVSKQNVKILRGGSNKRKNRENNGETYIPKKNDLLDCDVDDLVVYQLRGKKRLPPFGWHVRIDKDLDQKENYYTLAPNEGCQIVNTFYWDATYDGDMAMASMLDFCGCKGGYRVKLDREQLKKSIVR